MFPPQTQQFFAQVCSRQHVERAKGLIHKEQFRFDHQGTGKTHALAHSAGEFLRIGILKAVQTNQVDGGKRALEPLGWRERLCFQAQLYVLQHCQPGKERKGLEHDGDMRIGSLLRYPLEEHLPTRWR